MAEAACAQSRHLFGRPSGANLKRRQYCLGVRFLSPSSCVSKETIGAPRHTLSWAVDAGALMLDCKSGIQDQACGSSTKSALLEPNNVAIRRGKRAKRYKRNPNVLFTPRTSYLAHTALPSRTYGQKNVSEIIIVLRRMLNHHIPLRSSLRAERSAPISSPSHCCSYSSRGRPT